MAVSSKVKAALNLKGKDHSSLANYLGISNQALSNKFYRDSFSAEDLIKISAFLECDLAFIINDTTTIVFDESDIKATNK